MIPIFIALSLYCANLRDAYHGGQQTPEKCNAFMISCAQDNWTARNRGGFIAPDDPGKIYIDCVANWKKK